MSTREITRIGEDAIEEHIRKELGIALRSKNQRIFGKVAMAALSSIPWVGGFLSTAADLSGQDSHWQIHQLYWQWFEVHRQKMNRLGQTLVELIQRLENLADVAEDRLQSREYLKIVSKGFHLWDRTESDEKRRLVQRLLVNSAAESRCSDAVIDLFVAWLNRFDDSHLSIIRILQQSKQLRQSEIWYQLFGNGEKHRPAEGMFFQRLIQELLAERVIAVKPTDGEQKPASPVDNGGWSVELLDEDQNVPDKTRLFVMTELGLEFCRLVMGDQIPRIRAKSSAQE